MNESENTNSQPDRELPAEYLSAHMLRYRCHKEVQAARIVTIGEATSQDTARVLIIQLPDGWKAPFVPTSADMLKRAAVGDYAILYRDGYKSISPKTEFEDGYSPIEDADCDIDHRQLDR